MNQYIPSASSDTVLHDTILWSLKMQICSNIQAVRASCSMHIPMSLSSVEMSVCWHIDNRTKCVTFPAFALCSCIVVWAYTLGP